jgi:hypothetical protein
MVDPTWGNTTGGVDYFDVFDFSHITFVIKGADSSYPIPAGGYKLDSSKKTKDVVIIPTSDGTFPLPRINAKLLINKKNFSSGSLAGSVQLINPSGVVYPPSEIVVTSATFTPEKQKITVSELLPFANTIVPFSFDKTGLFTTKHGTITALIGGTEIKETVSVVPFYLIVLEKPYITWLIGGGVVFASIALIIFVLTRRSGNLPVS